MIIRKCDKCNKTIEGNYWTICIYQKADKNGKISTKGACNNLDQFCDIVGGRQKEYCEECIDDIKEYIARVNSTRLKELESIEAEFKRRSESTNKELMKREYISKDDIRKIIASDTDINAYYKIKELVR